mmetsp:Transcript_37391/g.59925  ORF Transcript_37391/g.59925 Transcript_37391/m.59925 type:complete len:387 (-) Transcript_37391:353-1513(-)
MISQPEGFSKTSEDSIYMKLERLRTTDVNGLMGKTRRNPLTGKISIKDVSHERDFTLVDMKQRFSIEGMPLELADDEHLFLPRAMNYRTWVYHDRFRAAEAAHNVGGRGSETFLWESLNERCIDFQELSTGLYSSAMVYLPVVPFTLLANDATVFVAMGIVTAFCMIVSVATNSGRYYFWARPITAPFRFAMLIITLVNIGGDMLKIVGYLITFFAVLVDFGFGDMRVLCSGHFYCRYELVRALPNQVFVCRRKGDNARIREPRKALAEKFSGIMESGQNEVCLLANLQGLLVELVPVDANIDYPSFDHSHTQRRMDPSISKLKYMGVDIFVGNLKSVHDYEILEENMKVLKKRAQEQRAKDSSLPNSPQARGKQKHGDLKVVDIV